MSRQRSRSSPCRIIRTEEAQPLSPERKFLRTLARRANEARKQAEKDAYEAKMNLTGLRRQ